MTNYDLNFPAEKQPGIKLVLKVEKVDKECASPVESDGERKHRHRKKKKKHRHDPDEDFDIKKVCILNHRDTGHYLETPAIILFCLFALGETSIQEGRWGTRTLGRRGGGERGCSGGRWWDPSSQEDHHHYICYWRWRGHCACEEPKGKETHYSGAFCSAAVLGLSAQAHWEVSHSESIQPRYFCCTCVFVHALLWIFPHSQEGLHGILCLPSDR